MKRNRKLDVQSRRVFYYGAAKKGSNENKDRHEQSIEPEICLQIRSSFVLDLHYMRMKLKVVLVKQL